MYALILIACGQRESPEPLGPPLSDVLPSCFEAARIADEDVYRDENPFEGLHDEPGWQKKPMNAKWAEGTGIQAQYVRGCGDVDSDLVRTDVYEFANEEDARAYVLGREELYACDGQDRPLCLSVLQSAVDPDRFGKPELRTSLDEALQRFVGRVPAVFAGMSSGVENLGREDWVYEEAWIVLWPQKRYVVNVLAQFRDRDFIVSPDAPAGVIPARRFDLEHMAGALCLEILDRWPDDLGRSSGGTP